MQDGNVALNPLVQYSPIWLYIGLGLIAVIAMVIVLLLYLTRKRKVTTIADLRHAPATLNLEQLKQKYLRLIDECYASYKNKESNLRGLHRGLSMAARYFVYEVNHFPAPRLTLSDLKHAPHHQLTALIDDYYAKEFSAIEHGSAEQSVQKAKEFIQQWI